MDFFAKLGYTCPDNCNPADYIFMEVLNALADKSDMEFDAMASFVGEWPGLHVALHNLLHPAVSAPLA